MCRNTFLVDESADISMVASLKDRLLGYLDSSDSISVDLSSISRIDSSGFQLLLALKLEAAKRRKPCDFLNPSEIVRHHAEALGLTAELF